MARLLRAFACVMLIVAGRAQAEVRLTGQVPVYEIPGLQKNLDQIWNFVAGRFLKASPVPELPPPEIAFYEFERAEETADWQSWQNDWIRRHPGIWLEWTILNKATETPITAEWIDQHIETLFPFPPTFLAFHYDGTNHIQVSPSRTFLRFYVKDPYGVKRETVGYGYYTAAHEMLHYVLEQNGVPGRLHHCLFVIEKEGRSLMSEITHYLIGSHISAPIIENFGYNAEKSMLPCEVLSEAERTEVDKFRQAYGDANTTSSPDRRGTVL